jgi:3-hydroxybutyryl-CoA dehydrogenase
MEIGKATVLGAGIMGAGIAQVAAQAGLEVKMRDVDQKFIDSGMNAIKQSLARFVKKGTVTQEQEGADVVIEAIPENLDLKKQTYAVIDKACPPEVIFASNTSGLSITEMASATSRPAKFAGMHFFNPVPMMQLVEVVKGYSTADDTIRIIRDLSTKMGKRSIVVKDTPGFATSRFTAVLQNEAICAYAEGIASAEDIDTAMKLGMNHPMGPLELADLVGLDTLLHVLENLYREFGDPKYRPAHLLRQMVRAGHLGRKTGRGIYDYSKSKTNPEP